MSQTMMQSAPFVSLVLNWIMFLALFPIAFIWLRRAWRILFRKDFSEVALKGGEPPEDPAKWAPYTATLNLIAGTVVAWTIFGIVSATMDYDTWTALAGITIWSKFLLDFGISRQAHARWGRAKKEDAATDAKAD